MNRTRDVAAYHPQRSCRLARAPAVLPPGSSKPPLLRTHHSVRTLPGGAPCTKPSRILRCRPRRNCGRCRRGPVGANAGRGGHKTLGSCLSATTPSTPDADACTQACWRRMKQRRRPGNHGALAADHRDDNGQDVAFSRLDDVPALPGLKRRRSVSAPRRLRSYLRACWHTAPLKEENTVRVRFCTSATGALPMLGWRAAQPLRRRQNNGGRSCYYLKCRNIRTMRSGVRNIALPRRYRRLFGVLPPAYLPPHLHCHRQHALHCFPHNLLLLGHLWL